MSRDPRTKTAPCIARSDMRRARAGLSSRSRHAWAIPRTTSGTVGGLRLPSMLVEYGPTAVNGHRSR